jgi:phospholipid/cholesterol/gamma-HCH transport system substrate-binding protein
VTEIRKQLPNFIAITVLFVIAIFVTYYILQEQRLRIPIVEDRPFEMKAEFETAQAVVPGQGQTIRVAGVRVGDVTSVEVEDGKGVVTFNIDRKYLPVYRDATILMRPTTGLKDMFFDMDPGTRAAGEFEEGETITVANTAPDVNLDEILEILDGDTQAYLRLLLVGAGKGLEGRDKELGELLGGLGPINRDLKQLNTEVAKRQTNLRNLVHNFNILTGRIGQNDDDLAQLVTESNTALGSIAEQDPHVQRAVSLLPGTLQQAEETLNELTDFGAVLGPTFNDLRPFARNLDEANASLAELGRAGAPILENEVRPFVRAARKPIPDLERAAGEFSKATPRLTVVGEKINRLGNMAAYNPNGAEPACPPDPAPCDRDEGYLYWAAWLGHNSSNVFSASDGGGLYRRIYFTAGCDQIRNIIAGESPVNPIDLAQQITGQVTGLGPLVFGGACTPP